MTWQKQNSDNIIDAHSLSLFLSFLIIIYIEYISLLKILIHVIFKYYLLLSLLFNHITEVVTFHDETWEYFIFF